MIPIHHKDFRQCPKMKRTSLKMRSNPSRRRTFLPYWWLSYANSPYWVTSTFTRWHPVGPQLHLLLLHWACVRWRGKVRCVVTLEEEEEEISPNIPLTLGK
uniref:Uncharacterized protein n=1 Tax=Cacopsylla melanoneura TaxID=428564 RepID=A0A8D9E277_9HEMI